ncbi:uncharacterized protein LOC125187626 isoform X2 [Salvia hispanica]|nr:uncharacterized protein LOC125187626 isoform X2 [Salvia hispanica]
MKIIPQWRADRRPIRTARFLLWWGPSIANALISSHTQHNLSLSRPREMLHSSVAITFPKLTRSSQSTSTSDFHRPCIADFKRFKTDGHAQLQTALHTYHNKFPFSIFQPFLRVDLVSTIHIADKEYFASLQKELEGYDCVLYEMIASRRRLKNSRGPGKKLKSSSSRGFSIIGCIQQLMAKLLVLDFQLDCLDYKADNWYHADLDTETFKLLQLEKGESFFTLARDMTLKSRKAMVQPVCVDIGNQSEYPELEAVSKIDFCAAMKVFLAKKLTSG